ncbi:MFS general substrate transporter [Rickenella mellea]|uniref:MFS general substrate transporter n=1 Tax=Rickenella mellea TaxID=50990 RepID=A0A4Y7QKG5_9AGAM|nr:MFS general substrate transporter [Rickenella mellea]
MSREEGGPHAEAVKEIEVDPRLPDILDLGFPDGGLRAWLVVFGCACICGSTFGFVNSWGAFQSYYEHNILQDRSPSNIAWIGSIQYSLTFFPALLVGRLFDLGWFRAPLLSASCTMVAATFLTAECKAYWHFLLCQGIAIGLCSGVIYGPCLGVLSHWFKGRLSTVLGVVAGGSSIGGTLFPIVFRNLVVKIGFPWTMRVLGFMLMTTLGVANLTVARRLPPVNASGGMLNLKAFRSTKFSVYTSTGFFAFLGLYTVLTYIDPSATADGVPETFSFYLVSIANAGSFFGRIGGGILADRIGPINVMAPFTAVAAVLTMIWPFVHGKSAFVAIAIVYGMSSGAYVSLIAAPMIAFGETDDVGRRTGMFLTVLAVGALSGPPISGAINAATQNYKAVGVYAGSMIFVSVALLWVTKYLVIGRFGGKL